MGKGNLVRENYRELGRGDKAINNKTDFFPPRRILLCWLHWKWNSQRESFMGMRLVINSSWMFWQNGEKLSGRLGVGTVIITRGVKVKGCQLFHLNCNSAWRVIFSMGHDNWTQAGVKRAAAPSSPCIVNWQISEIISDYNHWTSGMCKLINTGLISSRK